MKPNRPATESTVKTFAKLQGLSIVGNSVTQNPIIPEIPFFDEKRVSKTAENVFRTNTPSLIKEVQVQVKDGTDGKSATIKIGKVTTGDAGTEASVTNSGTETDAIFDFVIPRGADGVCPCPSGEGIGLGIL